MSMVDAVVIGGGFYGSVVANYLVRKHGLKKVILIEKEKELLSRASYNNQARVHNGYHYPRSFTTAFRSRINFSKFIEDWGFAVKKDFTNIYAISKINSKITSQQFKSFCNRIGANIYPANSAIRNFFNPKLIEDIFITEEYTFDATKIARRIKKYLMEADIEVQTLTKVIGVSNADYGKLIVKIQDSLGNTSNIYSKYVFNCTYSNLNQLDGDSPRVKTKLKHEITEMALIQMPGPLSNMGITVMDGPFFSIMPFPSQNLHTLSHVRYTPHYSWNDHCKDNPHFKLNEYDRNSRVELMIRDVGRYLPCITKAKYAKSLFEIKTVLEKNEDDDGRPILFEKYETYHRYFSILGGKIDNIYDIFDKLDYELLQGYET